MDMPKTNLAASIRSCNISVRPRNTPSCSPYCGKPSATLSLQQSRCKIYDGTRQTEYQIHVRDGKVDKSLHQNYRKQSHVCASISPIGANRSSVWQLPKTFDCLTSNPPPSAPLCLEGQFGWRISIPRWICRCVPNCVPIGPAVWHLLNTFEFVTPYPPPWNAPCGIEGRLVFSPCPFPDESADVNQCWCQSDSFPILLNCWPPKTPQVCIEGQFVWRISIPLWIGICVPNVLPIGPAVW